MRRFSLGLVRDGLVHNVASDAHDQTGRPPTIAAELERAGLGSLAGWLTQAVPAAILDGGRSSARSRSGAGGGAWWLRAGLRGPAEAGRFAAARPQAYAHRALRRVAMCDTARCIESR